MKVEVFMRVDVFCPLSLGIGRKDRRELAGLHALLKRALEQLVCQIWGEPGC